MLEISVKKLLRSNIFELLKLAWSLNENALKEGFAKVGILIENPEDLKILAKLHNEGGDIAGDFKNLKGEPIIFNVEEVLADVEMDENDKEKKLNLNWE